MGLSLIFCAGADAEAPKKILKALETVDYEALEPLIARKADFSLHLIPRDLELLSQCAAPFSARKEAPFRAGLTCYLDEADRGLFIVSEEWEQYMAAIDPAKATDRDVVPGYGARGCVSFARRGGCCGRLNRSVPICGTDWKSGAAHVDAIKIQEGAQRGLLLHRFMEVSL